MNREIMIIDWGRNNLQRGKWGGNNFDNLESQNALKTESATGVRKQNAYKELQDLQKQREKNKRKVNLRHGETTKLWKSNYEYDRQLNG